MRWNKKLFPPLNVINVKTSPYGSNGILRHYHYRLDPKLSPGIVAIRIISCSYHDCTTILSLSWGLKIKKKQLISLYMVDYIISSTLKLLVVTITEF